MSWWLLWKIKIIRDGRRQEVERRNAPLHASYGCGYGYGYGRVRPAAKTHQQAQRSSAQRRCGRIQLHRKRQNKNNPVVRGVRDGPCTQRKPEANNLHTIRMDSSNVLQLLEQLDDEIDDLEESLAPLLKNALSESASKLPLLDKAKLYVLVTYAIESIIFGNPHPVRFRTFANTILTLSPAYLRLNGVKAREHPVFKELTRVKQYFDKIKTVETPVAERTMAVDKGAAARFIKAGLVCSRQA